MREVDILLVSSGINLCLGRTVVSVAAPRRPVEVKPAGLSGIRIPQDNAVVRAAQPGCTARPISPFIVVNSDDVGRRTAPKDSMTHGSLLRARCACSVVSAVKLVSRVEAGATSSERNALLMVEPRGMNETSNCSLLR